MLFTDGAYTDTMTLKGGNVGIGTTSPAGKLMVREDSAGNPTRLIVSNGGTVQSGTTARLSFYEGTSEKGYIERRRDGSGKIAFVTPADDNPFVWENLSGEIMRITNSKVGIGTTSPGYKLDVESSATPLHLNRTGGATALIGLDIAGVNRGLIGATTTAAFVSYSTTAAPLTTILNTGNVGIGTISPGRKLHIDNSSGVGEAVISGTTGAVSYTHLTLPTNREV